MDHNIGQAALYKGEKLLAIGSINKIAKQRHVKPGTIAYYATPTYKRRTSKKAMRLVKLD